ncbi:hypothetical protein OUZ56_001476 [Daphnia magna]|uniref:Uncharacterized protein n=1 Tax=Daphnia magna TaxID=35525 RepID=A0ABR0A2S9_9CRUS|nr:hypothetical protein OUZ56_001476 [Daphnia magna]
MNYGLYGPMNKPTLSKSSLPSSSVVVLYSLPGGTLLFLHPHKLPLHSSLVFWSRALEGCQGRYQLKEQHLDGA